MGREIKHLVRAGIQAQVVNDFRLNQITGLASLPTFTQRLTHRTVEPYVHFRSESSLKLEFTKASATREYATIVEIRDSYTTGTGGPHIVDQIADEVVAILDREPPAIVNNNAYLQVIDSVRSFKFEKENKTYFQTNITVLTRVQPGEVSIIPGQTLPVQVPQYTYAGFEFMPTSALRIEDHDAGTITGAEMYPSNNNGYDFTGVVYSAIPGSDGSLADRVYTVEENDDTLGIVSNISYENEVDSTITETLTATTNWNRIRSLRYGTVAPTTGNTLVLTDDNSGNYGVRNLPVWNTGSRTLDFGRVSPVHQFTINVVAGETTYFLFDSGQDDLTEIRQHILGGNIDITARFTGPLIVGDYKLYYDSQPAIYGGDTTFNLT